MNIITEQIKEEIETIVYDFFEAECEVERDILKPETNIIDELEGDSLMYLELIEILKKKYNLSIQMQVLGKYLLKNPAETIQQVIETSYLIYEKENDIAVR